MPLSSPNPRFEPLVAFAGLLFFAAGLAPWLRRANRRPDARQALLRSLWNDARCLDAPPYQEGRADALHTFLRCRRRLRHPARPIPRGASEIGPAGVRAGRARARGRARRSRRRRGAGLPRADAPGGGGIRSRRPLCDQQARDAMAGAEVDHGSGRGGDPAMIARLWSADTTSGQAPAYAEHLRTHVLPALNATEGYAGTVLVERTVPAGVQTLATTWWRSVKDISGFAGADPEQAVVADEAARLLTRLDRRVRHFRLVMEDRPPAFLPR